MCGRREYNGVRGTARGRFRDTRYDPESTTRGRFSRYKVRPEENDPGALFEKSRPREPPQKLSYCEKEIKKDGFAARRRRPSFFRLFEMTFDLSRADCVLQKPRGGFFPSVRNCPAPKRVSPPNSSVRPARGNTIGEEQRTARSAKPRSAMFRRHPLLKGGEGAFSDGRRCRLPTDEADAFSWAKVSAKPTE